MKYPSLLFIVIVSLAPIATHADELGTMVKFAPPEYSITPVGELLEVPDTILTGRPGEPFLFQFLR